MDSGYSYCTELTLRDCKTGGFDECYKECLEKRGLSCEPYVGQYQDQGEVTVTAKSRISDSMLKSAKEN